MDIVMSTKPQYVKQIQNCTKRYEYRKHGFTKPIRRVYLYESSPVRKITGYFTLNGIEKGTPLDVWLDTNKHAGMNEHDFFNYYKFGSKTVYALEIKHYRSLRKPKDLKDFGIKHAPESFQYIR